MREPFEAIPAEAAAVLRPVLPGLADETIAAIAVEVPDYARAMEGPFGDAVRRGVEQALGRFVDAVADPAGGGPAADETYVALGRGELRVGRSLDALLAAYRVGARLAWRRFVEAGVAAGLPPATLYRLGEAIFAYIDAISAESAAGYAEEQSALAGERERRRRALVRVLAQHPPADEESVRTAADAAGWPLPRTLAAVALAEGSDEDAQRVARRLDPGALGAEADGAAYVVVPDPGAPGRRALLARALGGRAAALGPEVAWGESGQSASRALAAARLLAAGRLAPAPGEAPLVLADEHLAALAVHADPGVAGALARRALAPLEPVAGPARERLRETLAAWLDQPGQIQAIAARLSVHPQTVRYRLRRLRELYGAALEDPDERLTLALGLRAGADSVSV